MIRRRIRPARHAPGDSPLLHRIASILLRYPDETVLGRLDEVTAALPALADAADRDRLAHVTGALRALTPTAAAQGYVETFDHTRRRSLHLTYYRHGDTRARGMALLALKHVYRQAGHEPPGAELPDFLPLVLEFASLAPEPGRRVLLQCQSGLELLRGALRDRDDLYAPVLDAVCGRLPAPRGRDRDTLRRLATEGPPREEVGLEPFAPPEYMGAAPTERPGAPSASTSPLLPTNGDGVR
ncbi:nitrate reductase molybdenum cofactor assembly chaperone [Streptomyces sp. NPDC047028]|uniref:nitrate reductase molybdenum cofactor assembly chaperone n=1 Tax=Streptomyces sp. NPDC047028 TaxID=3155793 RepID=UPI0033FDCE2B